MPKSKNKKTVKKSIKAVVKKVVKQTIASESEIKYLHRVADFSNGSQVILRPYISQQFLLNDCTQGDTVNSRQGNKILPTYMDIDIELNPTITSISGVTGATGGYDTTIRYGVVYDRQPDKTSISLSGSQQLSVFDDLGIGKPYTNMKRLSQNMPRYKVLLDKTTTCNITSSIARTLAGATDALYYNQEHKHFKHKIPLHNGRSLYSANTGDITDITVGSYYFFAFADNNCFLSYDIKTYFSDM